MNIKIEPVTKETLPDVLELFGQYQIFYKTEPDPDRNKEFLKMLLDSPDEGIQFVALQDGKALGFATLYYTYSSVSVMPMGLLNDLYTIPESRGKGVGRALMNHCAAFLKSKGFKKMFWNTATDNHTAQKLYDTFSASKATWLQYTILLDD